MTFTVLVFANLFLAGILAGEELIIRYGVRGPLARMEDRAHIQMRQGLIRTLRILVPAIFLPALASAIAVAALVGSGSGQAYRGTAVAALAAWILITLFGTVPINEAAAQWDPGAPPTNWKATVDRWEGLNTVRTPTAVLAFTALLIGAALQAAGA